MNGLGRFFINQVQTSMTLYYYILYIYMLKVIIYSIHMIYCRILSEVIHGMMTE